jgi:thiol-disulfide isomerase/thioredoxin
VSRIFLFSVAALVALMVGALFYAAKIPLQSPQQVEPQQIEQPAMARPIVLEVVSHPSFSLPDVEGTSHDFSEWQGKNRLINFWATWCAPCRREIPLLKTFQDEQSGNGFQVIGIAVDFVADVARYAETAEFNYPILVGEQEAMAVAESSGIEFIGLPFTMFVASDGEYLGAYLGELHASHLQRVVDTMTQLDRGEISKDAAKENFERL